MNTTNTKTTVTKPSQVKREWHLIDLKGQTLGREATKIARLLIGKDKTNYMPHVDCGDYVVVINAGQVEVTGNKYEGKLYRHHTGHPGGFREKTYKEVFEADPKKVIMSAVSGMLPKNRLRDPRLKRLKVFVNEAHTYENQFKSQESK